MCLIVTSAPLSCLGATAPPRCRARGCALQCEAPWRSAQAGHYLYLARISAKCDAVLSSLNLVSSFPSTGPQVGLHCFIETSPDTNLNPPCPPLHAGAGWVLITQTSGGCRHLGTRATSGAPPAVKYDGPSVGGPRAWLAGLHHNCSTHGTALSISCRYPNS